MFSFSFLQVVQQQTQVPLLMQGVIKYTITNEELWFYVDLILLVVYKVLFLWDTWSKTSSSALAVTSCVNTECCSGCVWVFVYKLVCVCVCVRKDWRQGPFLPCWDLDENFVRIQQKACDSVLNYFWLLQALPLPGFAQQCLPLRGAETCCHLGVCLPRPC